MRKFYFGILAIFLLVSCEHDVEDFKADNLGAILFDINQNNSSRGVVTTSFAENTAIAINLESIKDGGEAVRRAQTSGTTTKGSGVETSPTIYWDDMYGKEAHLSVYAAAYNGKQTVPVISADNKLSYSVPQNLDYSKFDDYDLLFSNNLRGDSCVTFNNSTSRFEVCNMVFQHAFAFIKINVNRGEGFTSLTEDSIAVVIKDQYTSGTINLEDDCIVGVTEGDLNAFTPDKYQYGMFVIPDNGKRYSPGDVIAQIMVNGLAYNVKIPASFIEETGGRISCGNIYTFETTINKSGMSVSASINPWTGLTEQVKGQLQFSNSINGVNDSISSRIIGEYDLYVKEKGVGIYKTQPTTLTWNNESKEWEYSSSLYWETDNSRYFRAVSPINIELNGSGEIELQSGQTDYIYGTSGVDDVEPTFGNVPLQFSHVMSRIVINITTSLNNDKVALDQAVVKLNGVATSAKFNIWSGATTLSGTDESIAISTTYNEETSTAPASHVGTIYCVPQTFTNSSEILVRLKNGTEYVVALNKCDEIEEWLGNNEYTYNVVLTKATQKVVTQALAGWVSGSNNETTQLAEIQFTNKLNALNNYIASESIESFNLYTRSFGAYLYEYISTATWQDSDNDGTNDEWVYSPKSYWADASGATYFRAISPQTVSADVNGQVSLVNGETDYLFGTTGGSPIQPTKGNVALNFYHIMSKVQINVSTTLDSNKVDLQDATLKIEQLYSEGIFDIHGGEVIATKTIADIEYPAIFTPETSSVSAKLCGNKYLVPQSISNNNRAVIVLTLSDGSEVRKLLKDFQTIPTWIQNNMYTYNIQVGKDSMGLSVVTLSDWVGNN